MKPFVHFPFLRSSFLPPLLPTLVYSPPPLTPSAMRSPPSIAAAVIFHALYVSFAAAVPVYVDAAQASYDFVVVGGE